MIETERPTSTRWDLTAPESLVLRDGTRAKPAEVLKLAVLELVTRRVLRLVEVDGRDWRGRPKPELVIGVGSRPAPRDGPLGIIATIALETDAKTYPDGTVGLSLAAFTHAFRVRHGNSPGRYIERSVLPALEARGLYAGRQGKWLGLFAHTSWERTSEGDRALAQLEELLSSAERDAAEWAERDPARLARYLVSAGGAALLVPSAYPVFEAFDERLRGDGDDGAIVPILAATTTTVAPDDQRATEGMADAAGFDLAGIDLSTLTLDFSALSGLEGGLAGIDAGLSAGMASADGGGGDGGGGGGGD